MVHFKIEYSDDNSTYEAATDVIEADHTFVLKDMDLNYHESHQYWRFYIIDTNYPANQYIGLRHLQFYGR